MTIRQVAQLESLFRSLLIAVQQGRSRAAVGRFLRDKVRIFLEATASVAFLKFFDKVSQSFED